RQAHGLAVGVGERERRGGLAELGLAGVLIAVVLVILMALIGAGLGVLVLGDRRAGREGQRSGEERGQQFLARHASNSWRRAYLQVSQNRRGATRRVAHCHADRWKARNVAVYRRWVCGAAPG